MAQAAASSRRSLEVRAVICLVLLRGRDRTHTQLSTTTPQPAFLIICAFLMLQATQPEDVYMVSECMMLASSTAEVFPDWLDGALDVNTRRHAILLSILLSHAAPAGQHHPQAAAAQLRAGVLQTQVRSKAPAAVAAPPSPPCCASPDSSQLSTVELCLCVRHRKPYRRGLTPYYFAAAQPASGMSISSNEQYFYFSSLVRSVVGSGTNSGAGWQHDGHGHARKV